MDVLALKSIHFFRPDLNFLAFFSYAGEFIAGIGALLGYFCTRPN